MAQKIGFLKKANEPTEWARTEQNIAQVEGEIQQRVYQLGQLFYEENKANENVDSKYYSLVDTIAKLELNRMGFYKNKLRLQGQMMCENCGTVIPYGSIFCSSCGKRADEREAGNSPVTVGNGRKCAKCGAPMEEDSLFCVSCGAKAN